MIKIAIIGLGARGAEVYGAYSLKHKDEIKVVAISDVSQEKLNKYAKIFKIPDNMCFKNGEELLKQEKLADAIVIASPDHLHYNHTMKALEVGYHILLEKPISPNQDECIEMVQKANRLNKIVAVCHVLRYAPLFQSIKDIIDSGEIGEIVHINQIENVGYWHQAHSFVRGNWRKKSESSPMILAKSCHDLDIISWFINKPCVKISSFGSLKYFRKENQPRGATNRCLNGCQVKDTCPYDAEKIYIENFKQYPTDQKEVWPFIVLDNHPSEITLKKALLEGPYGRCVYDCDNDVVDHQIVNMEFIEGVTASFTMCAFSGATYRQVKVMGTKGEIIANDLTQKVEVKVYNGEFDIQPKVIDINSLNEDLSGHSGGDDKLLFDFIKLVESQSTNGTYLTSLNHSLQSHLMAFASEQSRINDGEIIYLKEEVKNA